MENKISHAGYLHNADCRFPTEDAAVCNCTEIRAPRETREKWPKENIEILGSIYENPELLK